jgi:hypothetical protein
VGWETPPPSKTSSQKPVRRDAEDDSGLPNDHEFRIEWLLNLSRGASNHGSPRGVARDEDCEHVAPVMRRISEIIRQLCALFCTYREISDWISTENPRCIDPLAKAYLLIFTPPK